MKLTNEQKNRLNFILKRIENGKAEYSEYQEYETLLIESGVPLSKIRKPLTDAGINTWQEYIKEREMVKVQETEKVQLLLVIVLGAIIALGIGVVIGIRNIRNMANNNQ